MNKKVVAESRDSGFERPDMGNYVFTCNTQAYVINRRDWLMIYIIALYVDGNRILSHHSFVMIYKSAKRIFIVVALTPCQIEISF